MGIPYGAPDDPQTLLALVARLPPGAVFSAFSIGRMQLPYVALAALAGGNVRVGLEDNLYLARGGLATNAELVERAVDDPRGDERARPRPGRGARAARLRAPWLSVAGLLGGGVIGGGWAARFLLNGDRRPLYDPDAGRRTRRRRDARQRAPRATPADARAAAAPRAG